ncbi:hypothetical protein ACFYP6_21940 [Streptomyces goshikiensis]|uniref:hypothetical protein n=1 Tax=Streptomyces goshikiensis TaxID=1942 RepID=UPI0036B25A45
MSVPTITWPYPVADPPRIDKEGAAEIVRVAFVFQHLQNIADTDWVKDLGIDRQIAERILTRLGQRGAGWLDFVTIATAYDGDFGMISAEMLDKEADAAKSE